MKKTNHIKKSRVIDLYKFIAVEALLLSSFFPIIKESSALYWGTLSFACMMSLLAAFQEKGNLSPVMNIWLAAFGIWIGCSSVLSWHADSGFAPMKPMIILSLLAVLLLLNMRRERDLLICFYAILCLGIILTVYLCVQIGMGHLLEQRLGTGTGINSNELGQVYTYSILFCMHRLFTVQKARYGVYSAALFFLVLMTGSKSSLLLAVTGIFLYLFFRGTFRMRILLTGGSVMLCAVLFLIVTRIPFFYELTGKRLIDMAAVLTGKDKNASYSTSIRLEMLRYGLSFFKESALYGSGIGSFRAQFYNATGADYYSHNNYIEILVSFGIIGGIIFYSIFLWLLYGLYRQKHKFDSSALAYVLLLVLLASGLFSVNYNVLFTYVLLAAIYKTYVLNETGRI